mgnify:CR=1 FL=1
MGLILIGHTSTQGGGNLRGDIHVDAGMSFLYYATMYVLEHNKQFLDV